MSGGAVPQPSRLMKTQKHPAPLHEKLTLSLDSWDDYHDEIRKLERLLVKKPASVELELIGIGEMPPDSALIFRSVLAVRPRRTRIVTHARSSLKDSTVLLWLLGDRRMMRDDAHFLITAAGPYESPDHGPAVWRGPADETDVEEVDYVRVLHQINEYLPVREIAGQLIGRETLRQFGLVEHEETDRVLGSLLAKPRRATKAQPTTAPAVEAPQVPTMTPLSNRGGKPARK